MNRRNLAVTGVVVFVLVAVTFYFGFSAYAEHKARQNIDTSLEQASDMVQVDYEQLSVDLIGLNTRIKGVTLKSKGSGVQASIKEVIIYDLQGGQGEPEVLHARADGIRLQLKDWVLDWIMLPQLDYENTVSNLEIDYAYRNKDQRLILKSAVLNLKELAQINLNLDLGNIIWPGNDLWALFFTLPRINISQSRIIYKDQSLLSRIVALSAKRQNKSSRDVLQQWVETVKQWEKRVQKGRHKSSIQALKNFIQEPERIVIQVSPDQPVPLGSLQRLQTLEEVMDKLQVKISI